MHGASKRRKWVTWEVAVDKNRQEIIHFTITKGHEADCKIGPKIIEEHPKSDTSALGDGGYDTNRCRQGEAKALIPPRKNGRLSPSLTRRNNALFEIKGLGGDERARTIWAKLTGYSRSSEVESTIARWKKSVWGGLKSKTLEKIKKAVKYPIAVICVAVVVTGILLVKVVPTFQELFEGFGAELPAFTQFVIGLSEGLQANFLMVLVVAAALIIGFVLVNLFMLLRYRLFGLL